MDTSPDRIEAEVKAPLEDADAFRARLLDWGAKPAGSVQQVDRYFDHPTRSFGETDEALRVREQAGATRLTYKGPRLEEETKSREEYDVGIEDADMLEDLLEALGFEHAATVVKHRSFFTRGDITATIDEVDGLGTYAEIETVVEGKDLDEASQTLLDLAKELELDELERRSYLELLIEKKEEGAGDPP